MNQGVGLTNPANNTIDFIAKNPKTTNQLFYVYVHTRNDTGTVFYVGKGRGNRAWGKDNRNQHWRNIVAKHGHTVHLVRENMAEQAAFELEKELIANIRAAGFQLVNMTDGGDGVSGLVCSAETRAKLSVNNGSRRPEVRAKISAAAKGKTKTAETRAKISANSGSRRPEVRAKLSEVGKGKSRVYNTPETPLAGIRTKLRKTGPRYYAYLSNGERYVWSHTVGTLEEA